MQCTHTLNVQRSTAQTEYSTFSYIAFGFTRRTESLIRTSFATASFAGVCRVRAYATCAGKGSFPHNTYIHYVLRTHIHTYTHTHTHMLFTYIHQRLYIHTHTHKQNTHLDWRSWERRPSILCGGFTRA